MFSPALAGERYRVLFVTPEPPPWSDRLGMPTLPAWLPHTLQELGCRVWVMAPRYRGVAVEETVTDFAVSVGPRRPTCVVRRAWLDARPDSGAGDRTPVYFLDNYHYFDRGQPAGFADDAERWAFFCRAALEACRVLDLEPDVMHLNDWPTAPMALLSRRAVRRDGSPGAVPTVLYVRSLSEAGTFAPQALEWLGLGESYLGPDELGLPGGVSFLKAGLLYADVLATGSRWDARQVQSSMRHGGPDDLGRILNSPPAGVVAGVDSRELDPRRDRRLYRRFDETDLEGRRENRLALSEELGLEPRPLPIVAVIAELTPAGGADVLLGALDRLLTRRLQLVVVGAGDDGYQQRLLEQARQHPGRMAVVLGYNTVLVRRLYAAADMALVLSAPQWESSWHLAAMRYGCVPVVRAVGCLADTVFDYDALAMTGNGFSFHGSNGEAMLHAVDRALDLYRQEDAWQRLVRKVMQSDHSWHRTAVEYVGLYAQAAVPARMRRLA